MRTKQFKITDTRGKDHLILAQDEDTAALAMWALSGVKLEPLDEEDL